MSDISPTLTKVANSGNAAPLSGSNAGVFAAGLGGGNFWDVILSQFGLGIEDENAGENLKNSVVLANAEAGKNAANKMNAVGTDNPLALLQIALASQNIDANGDIVLNTPETDPVKIQNQLELTNKVINHLKNILPGDADSQDGIFAAIIGKLQAKSDNLQASLTTIENSVITKDTAVEDIPMPLLIALGLSPSEISEVAKKIDQLEKKLGRDITVEDLIAGVGGLIAPAPETAIVAAAMSPASKNNNAQNVLNSIGADAEPTDDLAARLNALDVGGNDDDAAVDEFHTKTNRVNDLPDETNTRIKKDATAFKENLMNMMNAAKNAQTAKADITIPVSTATMEAEPLPFQQFGAAVTTMVSYYSSAAQAANFVSSGAMAGQPHPATQLVSAQLVRSAKNGNDNVITLRLDPPELGEVNVRLQFGKDKAVKAIITAEKPETFMMLQRDAHALERALQSSGLETNSESLTFELTDQGNFAHDNEGERGGEKNFGAKGGDQQDADADNIIHSTVAWQIDPSTGHVRYNIFA